MKGNDYLQQFALPNFYFFVTTAYDILRHRGVPVGKRDLPWTGQLALIRTGSQLGAMRCHEGSDSGTAKDWHGRGRRLAAAQAYGASGDTPASQNDELSIVR